MNLRKGTFDNTVRNGCFVRPFEKHPPTSSRLLSSSRSLAHFTIPYFVCKRRTLCKQKQTATEEGGTGGSCTYLKLMPPPSVTAPFRLSSPTLVRPAGLGSVGWGNLQCLLSFREHPTIEGYPKVEALAAAATYHRTI